MERRGTLRTQLGHSMCELRWCHPVTMRVLLGKRGAHSSSWPATTSNSLLMLAVCLLQCLPSTNPQHQCKQL